MKIDRTKLKKSVSEVPADCKALIDRIKACTGREDLLAELRQIKTWTFGKCELFHWADVLDICDQVLEKATKRDREGQWTLPCDLPDNRKEKEVMLQVLQFTALLIEHSFTRHLYNSMEHLTALLASSDMTVVLAVLNLLYVFSKRSNFITRLNMEKKQALVVRLTHLAESWGGKENGFGLAECCQDLAITAYPSSATTLHFEFYSEQKDEKSGKKTAANVVNSIHLENVDQMPKLASEIMEDILSNYKIPQEKQMLLFTHIRLAHAFSKSEKRIQCVQARLQAISILVYSNAIQENVNILLYSGLIEELVDILEVKDPKLLEIKAAALRTLTSIIHLERNPKLNNIIDATGASSYHGFLPVLVRNCIQHMTDPNLNPFPQPFATALFSFLYHLASYESGGEALVSCGMMESLLKVINWYGEGQEHITFVTRAVRVVDLITNLDMAAFHSHGGLSAFINRLEHEVDICRKEQPFVIKPSGTRSESTISIDTSVMSPSPSIDHVPMETETSVASNANTEINQGASTSNQPVAEETFIPPVLRTPEGKALQCFPQRAALLKSMLNFLKKAIPDPAFSESIRHLMDGSLPRSLKHIISNAEYYGPSLFLLATDVVTVYVFQEPSLLSSLQDNGLTNVVLHALLVKDQVPATREVLASLPNVFSALCLNARGLQAFVACKPFDRLFKVLLSPDYLPAMRRRRSSDPLGDTASNLGNAMDELMRHQPSLRTDATKAIIKLLEEVCAMGRDAKYMCQKPQPKVEQPLNITLRSSLNNHEATSSDDEDEDDEVASTHSSIQKQEPPASTEQTGSEAIAGSSNQERTAIPLMDYVLNVMKFVESILSNNTTDDHCREFVTQKGLVPLMGILGLPNLPVDFPASPSCQAVASVCKSILTLSHEPQVLKQGLLHLSEVLTSLEPLHTFLDPPGGSVLLRELANAPSGGDPTLSATATPLLHSLAAAHAYITMFTHVCKVGQSDIRSISVSHWGSELGLKVLKALSKLYTSLVWESTVLLAFCSEDILPAGCEFGKGDLEKIVPKDVNSEKDTKGKTDDGGLTRCTGEMGSNGVSAAMESLSTSENTTTPMETEEKSATDSEGKKSKISPTLQAQIKQIKPLLSASSRLGRALAELFGLLVKLCVGSPVRQRRSQIPASPAAPTPAARSVASALTKLLANGLSWTPPPASPVPKLRLTFFICSVGFTSPMLFDEKKFPYHLMLQKFLSSAGQDSLFRAFEWALSSGHSVSLEDGLENPELPDGTGEFLDAWLMLVEKMVNTKNVLESPHTLPAKSTQPGFSPFNALLYLIHTHKIAFHHVMHLWNKQPLKVYGGRMSESILAILCHIIKGEAVIKERLDKEREDNKGTTAPSTSAGAGAGASTSLATSAATSAATNAASIATTSAATSAGPGSLASVMAGANLTAGLSSGATAAAVNSTSPQEPEVNQEHLQQLMDMGFTREHCMEALLHSANLEQATDYILTHPPPILAAAGTTTTIQPPQVGLMQGLGMDVDLSEDDQMLRAIAMSLGENVLLSTDQEKKEEEVEKKEEEEESDVQKPEEPLEKDVIDEFTQTMMPGCMQLLDTLPETVYRVCDLIVVVTSRNGEKWRNDVLTGLVAEIAELALRLMEAAAPLTTSDSRSVLDWGNQLTTMAEAPKLAVRLHLLSLLFEGMRTACAEAVEVSGILDLLVRLLDSAQKCMAVAKEASTPKWVTPLLLLLDLYEKVAISCKRKAELESFVGESHVWKWFDDRSGRWCNYSNSNNKTIDDAYRAGESSVRFTASRRRYTVQFSSMVQVNEETGNRRPIMLSLPPKEDKKKEKEDSDELKTLEKKNKVESEKVEESKMETDEPSTSAEKEAPSTESKVVKGLMPDQISTVIRCSVSLIGIPVEPDSLHAVLRLTLRLTREHQFAVMFAELGGPKLLLGLTQVSAFQGFTSLATLLFRHILEEPHTLKFTLEKVIRIACLGAGSSMSGVGQGSIGAKEAHYVLRVLGPAACRCPEEFTEVFKTNVRIALPPAAKRDEDEARLVGPNTPQILKCLPTKQTVPPPLESPVKDVIFDLLNALAIKYSYKAEELGQVEVRQAQTLAEALQEVVNEVTRETSERQQMLRQDSSADLNPQEDDGTGPQRQDSNNTDDGQGSSQEPSTTEPPVKDVKAIEENDKKKRPLLPKSAVLRLLAELVRSYVGVAQMIAQYNYTGGQSELVPEDCNVLAFVLDHMLPQCQSYGDKDCPALARVLLASLAACNHSPDTQTILINELKTALQRSLALAESSEKHSRIQALTGIISTVIEACPSPGQIANQVFKGQQATMNNIVRILLKRGLVTDLARIPHSLDLASPSMANTINAALKPLETLSRIVNQPQTVVAKPKPKTTPEQSTAEGVVTESATSSVPAGGTDGSAQQAPSESRAEGDVRIEDVTGTENVDGLEETGPLEAVDPEMHADEPREPLDEVLDELLQRNTGRDPEVQVLGEIIIPDGEDPAIAQADESHDEVVIDVEIEDNEDDGDHHDSQMVSQMSEDETDVHAEQDDNDDGDSQDSASEADDDDDDNDDGDDDDADDDEDDEDDDDEDEGSDMEADNDDYQDMEESLYNRLNDNSDLFVQLEDMIPAAGPHVLFEDRGHMRTYQLPIAVHDADNGNEMPGLHVIPYRPSPFQSLQGPSVPPAPSNVTASHPLLVRTADHHTFGTSVATRVHRAGRQRGTYRYNPNTQTLHVHYTAPGRHPNPPAILQRLLGQNAAADVLQLTNTLSVGGNAQARFHFVSNDDLRLVQRPEDDIFEDLFQETYTEGGSSGSGVLSSVPSSLVRWTEEARVLDGDSVHDAITVLKPTMFEELEKHRDSELTERKEKRRKAAEEEAAKKEKDPKEQEVKKENTTEKAENPSSSASEAMYTFFTPASQSEQTPAEPSPGWSTQSSLDTNNASSTALSAVQDLSVSSRQMEVESSGVNHPEASVGSSNTGEVSTSSTSQQASSATPAPVSNLRDGLDELGQHGQSTAERITSAIMEFMLGNTQTTTTTSVTSTTSMAGATSTTTTTANLTSAISTSASSILTTPMPPPPLIDSLFGAESSYHTPDQPIPLIPPQAPGPPRRLPASVMVPPVSLLDHPLYARLPIPGGVESPMEISNVPQDMSLTSTSSADTTLQASTAESPDTTLPAQPPASLPLGDAFPTSSQGDLPGQGQGQAMGLDGMITPEEPSNITSSDAVTINSSGSGNSSEAPSTADANEQPIISSEPTTTSTTATTPVTTSSSSTPAAAQEGSSSNSDIPLPEGVDPSFLAALPDNIRQEVIAEQLRLQRIQQRAEQQRQQAEALGVTEVNPEFLAALPPNIQEEVLAQQRAEQSRLAAQTMEPPPPTETADPAGFISSLPTSLRQQVLADMDDSMVAVLPPDLAAEAQHLRRELEDRHRRLMQERLFAQGAASLSAFLRQSGDLNPDFRGLAGRLGTTRYTIRPPRTSGAPWGWTSGRTGQASQPGTVRLRGRHMLDHEALTCLLVLLFVDEPRLNTNRLHRVLRNLCYHSQTRTWVIKALLSILQRTSDNRGDFEECYGKGGPGKSSDKVKRKTSQPDASSSLTSLKCGGIDSRSAQPSWLSISLDAALGCRTNVFQIHRSGKKHGSSANTCVTIHPQASPLICRHVLETLISLAKNFPCQFLPQNKAKEAKCDSEDKESDDRPKPKEIDLKSTSIQASPAKACGKVDSKPDSKESSRQDADFWELLVRLDNMSGGKKGKGFQRLHSTGSLDVESTVANFESSPLGQLMGMLAHPVVRRSQLLTDRLLRLLGLVSIGLPDLTQSSSGASTSTATTTTASSTFAAPSTTSATTTTCSVIASQSASAAPAPSQPAAAEISQSETSSVSRDENTTDTQNNTAAEQPSQQEVARQDDTLGFSTTMDVSSVLDEHLTSTPLPGKKEKDEKVADAEEEKEEDAPVLENQLQLAVEVLTSKSCSEEGLEDATNLLVQLSRANNATRDEVLKLLLGGARELGMTVCQHIRVLYGELRQMNVKVDDGNGEEDGTENGLAVVAPQKGMLQDRFTQGTTIVVHAPAKIKVGGHELQLPSMSLLTNKTSSQQFLLRILKVIIQLREAARLAAKKSLYRRTESQMSNITEAMAFLEAEAEAIMEMVGRREQMDTSSSSGQPRQESQDTAEGGTTSADSSSRPSMSDSRDTPMEVDQPGLSSVTDNKPSDKKEERQLLLPRLSDQLGLEELWETLGECLTELARTHDHHAVLVLQPAVEAFFLVHAGEKENQPKEQLSSRREDQLAHLNADITAPASPSPAPSSSDQQPGMLTRENSVMSVSSVAVSLPPDTQKFLKFAETHRTVLNQILRQSTTPLAEGPFSVLVNHTRVLDFDVKRRYFRQELDRMDEGLRREDLAVHIRREHVFEDSFRELHRRSSEEWKHRFYIVFEGEEGQDAGGLLREWYLIISREVFNPNYALFGTSAGDRVTYTINPSSHCNSNHLSYFKFVGRIIAKAIYDNKLLECYFTRSFYKHIMGVQVRYTDMESEDYSFYQGLVYLLENNVKELGYELSFSTEIQEFGVTETRELKPGGKNISVTEENKKEYVKLVCQMKMTGAIRKQLNAYLEGFYDIIPKRLISIFNEQELELLISGLPTIDIDDLKANTEYHKYQINSLQTQWFWRALRSFDQAERAQFLQFVTGTSKVPLQGFAYLEGMNGIQKFQIHRDDRSTDRLPCAHTCFNQLDLPAYETYDKLRRMLLLAVSECSEGFGLA